MIIEMDDVTECDFFVITWIIDNFGYWNSDIHDSILTTKAFQVFQKSNATIELQPRGPDDLVAVRLRGFGQGLECCVSFIAPDESIIFSQEMTSDDDRDVLEFPPGPKLQDIFSRIRSEKDVKHRNRLTLVLRFQHEGSALLNMHTRLDVFETSSEISFSSSMHDGRVIDEVNVVEYPMSYGEMESVRLSIYSDLSDPSKILLAVQPESFHQKFMVLTSLSTLNSDGSVLRTEENSRIFESLTKWVFSKDLTRKEIAEKDISLAVNLKIVPSNGFRLLSSNFSTQSREVSVMPMKSFPEVTCDRPKEPIKQNSKNLDILTKHLKGLDLIKM